MWNQQDALQKQDGLGDTFSPLKEAVTEQLINYCNNHNF